MSVWQIELPFLSMGPISRIENECLVIRNTFIQRLCTIFTDLRHITIIPRQRLLLYHRRLFYFNDISQTIPFDDMSHLDYTFHSIGTDWGITAERFGRHDQVESFRVELVLKDGTRYPLCAFQGEGAVSTGWIGVIFGDDDLFDLSGTQESDSRRFVSALAKLLQIPMISPYITEEGFVTCPECDHPTSRVSATCLYCGHKMNSAEMSIDTKSEL